MSDTKASDAVRSNIWMEEPEQDNPFATRAAYCRGYDVYGEMLGQARWVEMLYLLFHEELPTPAQADLLEALADPGSIWPKPEHPPGFDPHGVSTATSVKLALARLADYGAGPCLPWLMRNLAELEAAAGRPLALSGVAAAAFADLGCTPEQGEMLHLLLRLPGAAAHALEQRPLGYKQFPFGTVELETTGVQA